MTRINECKSVWKSTNTTRLTILANGGEGKIQVDFVFGNENRFGKPTALIWDLYVSKDYRRRGIAKGLMEYALKRIDDYGFDTATLEWDEEDTPMEIYKWYESLGFEGKVFNRTEVLMEKEVS